MEFILFCVIFFAVWSLYRITRFVVSTAVKSVRFVCRTILRTLGVGR